MKRLLFTLLIMLATLPSSAQRFSPEDYQKRFEAFVAKEAGLAKNEAVKFFPLYHEMKDKQRVYYHEMRRIMQRTDIRKTSEADFHKLNDKVCELNLNTNKVEKEYIVKFRKIITDKKYFLVKRAEEKFQYQELRQHQRRQGEQKK